MELILLDSLSTSISRPPRGDAPRLCMYMYARSRGYIGVSRASSTSTRTGTLRLTARAPVPLSALALQIAEIQATEFSKLYERLRLAFKGFARWLFRVIPRASVCLVALGYLWEGGREYLEPSRRGEVEAAADGGTLCILTLLKGCAAARRRRWLAVAWRIEIIRINGALVCICLNGSLRGERIPSAISRGGRLVCDVVDGNEVALEKMESRGDFWVISFVDRV